MEDNSSSVDEFATKPEKTLDYINSALLTTIFVSFAVWWVFKNIDGKEILRRGLRSLALLFYFTSIFFGLYSDWLIIFLSSKINIDKNLVEKMGYIYGNYKQEIGTLHIDLITCYNIFLTTSQVSKICALFLMIGSWMPISLRSMSPGDSPGTSKKKEAEMFKKLSNASISVFSKLYILFRIPITFIFQRNQIFLTPDTILFTRSVFFGIEIAISALFLVILKTKYQGVVSNKMDAAIGSYTGVNILVVVLLMDSFFNHIINALSIPLIMDNVTTYVIEKIGFLTHIVSGVILLAILCPQKHKFCNGKISCLHQNCNTKKALDTASMENKYNEEFESDELVDLMDNKVEERIS